MKRVMAVQQNSASHSDIGFIQCTADVCLSHENYIKTVIEDVGFSVDSFPFSLIPKDMEIFGNTFTCYWALIIYVCKHNSNILKDIFHNRQCVVKQTIVLTDDTSIASSIFEGKDLFDVRNETDVTALKVKLGTFWASFRNNSSRHAKIPIRDHDKTKGVQQEMVRRRGAFVYEEVSEEDMIQRQESNLDNGDSFVDVETLKKVDLEPAMLIRRRLLSQETEKCSEEKYDEEQFILSHQIPKLTESEDIVALVKLLDCDNNKIIESALHSAYTLLFHIDISQKLLDEFLSVEESIWNILLRSVAHEHRFTEYTCVYKMVLCAIFFRTFTGDVSKGKEFNQKITKLLEQRRELLEKKKSVFRTSKGRCSYAVSSLSRFLEKLLSSGNVSELHFGDWNAALKHQETKDKLRKFATEAEFHEKFIISFRLISQFCRKNSSELLNMLHDCLMPMMNCKKEPEELKTVFRIFVAQAIVHVLDTKLKQGPKLKLIANQLESKGKPSRLKCKDTERLETILFDTVLSDIEGTLKTKDRKEVMVKRKEHLSEIIFPLVYHSSQTIRTKAMVFIDNLDRNNQAFFCLEKFLRVTGLDIPRDSIERITDIQTWYTFSCKVGKTHCVGYMLPPSGKNTIISARSSSHSSDHYPFTRNHLNTANVLKELPYHKNITTLIAYNSFQMPAVYVNEEFKGSTSRNFLDFLLDLRRNPCLDYANVTRRLIRLVMDLVSAVIFLHSRKCLHRDLTACRFKVSSDGSGIKLFCFRFAKFFENNEQSSICESLLNQLPIRWTAPESLLHDRFSKGTDRYMLGLLMLEIFCLGAWPFTELYQMNIGKLLELLVFHDCKPINHPCLPSRIYDLILKCIERNVEDRLSPEKLLEELKRFYSEADVESLQEEKNLSRDIKIGIVSEKQLLYPELCTAQTQQCLPETEVPESFKQLKNRDNPARDYYNIRRTRRRPLSKVVILESDLISPDSPEFRIFANNTLRVMEPIKEEFRVRSLPSIVNLNTSGIKGESLRPTHDGNYLVHRCKGRTQLTELAQKLPRGSASLDFIYYLHKFALAFAELHEKNWIHRDIRSVHLWVDERDRTVSITRLARMTPLRKYDSMRGEIFPDSWRWDAPEVLLYGLYSQKSDVYRFGMTLWECFKLSEVYHRQPTASPLQAVPYNHTRETRQVIDEQLCDDEEFLPKPKGCPIWIYNLIRGCCAKDASSRLTMDEVAKEISKALEQPNNMDDDESDNSGDTRGSDQLRSGGVKRIEKGNNNFNDLSRDQTELGRTESVPNIPGSAERNVSDTGGTESEQERTHKSMPSILIANDSSSSDNSSQSSSNCATGIVSRNNFDNRVKYLKHRTFSPVSRIQQKVLGYNLALSRSRLSDEITDRGFGLLNPSFSEMHPSSHIMRPRALPPIPVVVDIHHVQRGDKSRKPSEYIQLYEESIEDPQQESRPNDEPFQIYRGPGVEQETIKMNPLFQDALRRGENMNTRGHSRSNEKGNPWASDPIYRDPAGNQTELAYKCSNSEKSDGYLHPSPGENFNIAIDEPGAKFRNLAVQSIEEVYDDCATVISNDAGILLDGSEIYEDCESNIYEDTTNSIVVYNRDWDVEDVEDVYDEIESKAPSSKGDLSETHFGSALRLAPPFWRGGF